MRRYSNCWKKKCINSFTKRSKVYLSCEENYKRERGRGRGIKWQWLLIQRRFGWKRLGGGLRAAPRMKIHERLESKAVDIRVQKMASLTLNGHHYARPTNTRRGWRVHHGNESGYGSQGWRSGSAARWIYTRSRRLRGAPPPRHCRLACDV